MLPQAEPRSFLLPVLSLSLPLPWFYSLQPLTVPAATQSARPKPNPARPADGIHVQDLLLHTHQQGVTFGEQEGDYFW